MTARKIVRIIARLNIGGPARHTVLLTSGLRARGFSSFLVTGIVSPGEGDLGSFAEDHGVRPVVIPELQRDPRLFDDLRVFVKLCRLMFVEHPDVIHTHTAKAGALGRLAGLVYNVWRRLVGRPRAIVCHTFHGHLFHGYFPRWATAVLILGERLLARVTDRVIAISDQLKYELAQVYRICPESKCSVVPLGLDFRWTGDLLAFRGQLRREMGLLPESLTVGIVGRLTAIKNHEVFLEVARGCRIPGARFLVVGDGERRLELTELCVRLGLNGRVIFTGWQRDLAKIYADLDISCLTSLNEGTPVALIEAMAAGIPVVAPEIGGVGDLMTGSSTVHAGGFKMFANGILVPPGRPDLLTAALEFLAERPDVRQRMGSSGQSFVREKFSVERVVSETENLYLGLLSATTH